MTEFSRVASALADEVLLGYRDVRSAERLIGSLVLLSAGAAHCYSRATFFRRLAELRFASLQTDEVALALEFGAGTVTGVHDEPPGSFSRVAHRSNRAGAS